MTLLILQFVLAVVTLLMLAVRCQSCGRRARVPARRVVHVRQPLPVAHKNHLRLGSARTVALSTFPIPIQGTIEVAEPKRCAPESPAELRFAQPDAALLQRVLDGLRALPTKDDTPRS